MGLPDGGPLHVPGLVPEIPVHLVLDIQDLDGADARNALVVAAGDLRVDLTDLPVVEDQLSLEVGHQKHRRRQEQEDIEGQPGINGQHDRQDPDHIGAGPDQVHQSPGDRLADQSRIGYDSGVDIAYGILIVVGKGQGLQVAEGRIPQVPVDRHLHPAAGKGAVVVDGGLEHDHGQIEGNEEADPLHGPLPYVVIQGITVEERIEGVDGAGSPSQKDHDNDPGPVFLNIWKQPWNPEKRQFQILFVIWHCINPHLSDLRSAGHRSFCKVRSVKEARRGCPAPGSFPCPVQ